MIVENDATPQGDEGAGGCCTGTQNAGDSPRRFQLRVRFKAQAAPRKLGRFSTTMVPASLL